MSGTESTLSISSGNHQNIINVFWAFEHECVKRFFLFCECIWVFWENNMYTKKYMGDDFGKAHVKPNAINGKQTCNSYIRIVCV